MSPIRLILASLVHHWRMHAAVAFGVAAGTAVLTGALLVGDSMRGSLRALTFQRLGRVDEVLAPGTFFRAKLADELAATPGFDEHFAAAVPTILLRASLENPESDATRRANEINLIGCDGRFWNLDASVRQPPPRPRAIVLNRPLADRLAVDEGDALILRLPRMAAIPADSPLGRKTETITGTRVTVSRIIPAAGPGRFGLDPSQRVPLNAFVAIDWLGRQLDMPDRANVILAAGAGKGDSPIFAETKSGTVPDVTPTLDDLGIRVEKTERGYFNVTSDRMLLNPRVEKAMLDALTESDVQPALSYLANAIACGDRAIPYSIVTAVDFREAPPLGPLVDLEGRPLAALGDGEIVLNRWAAEQLAATPGETIELTYFEPESVDGTVRETTVSLRLAAIAELSGAAIDPDWTPEVAGVTDEAAMADWDPPFPFDAGRIRPADEEYWNEHRATPKAFVSLATGHRLWASRFGDTTSLRVLPTAASSADELAGRLRPDAAAVGFVFQPVKRQGLAASAGTTSFAGLFLGLSFFVIAAAVMLVALLFRLGIDGRAAQIGILLAVGLRRRQIARLLLAEGFCVAAVASLAGVLAGVGYAALMLSGLQSWWLDAVGEPFLRLFIEPRSLALGYFVGVSVALGAIAWSVWRAGRVPVGRLLAGRVGDRSSLVPPGRSVAGTLAAAILVATAVALGWSASGLREEARAGAFFGAGTLVLIAVLTLLAQRLRRGATGPAVAPGRGNLLRLAVRNAARNPGRSTLTVALVAAASFLIVSISAFRMDPSRQGPEKSGPSGGFSLWAQSTLPIHADLESQIGRRAIGFSDEDNRLLQDATVYSLRMRQGDDASCLNLYKPRQPTVLGMPEDFIARGGFAFSAVTSGTKTAPSDTSNPWRLLNGDLGTNAAGVPRVPVILDDVTATYALHKKLGDHLTIDGAHGGSIELVIVGLLKTSIFQGNLLVSEKNLLTHFPDTSGFRVFLVESSPRQTDAVAAAMNRSLGDFGLATETTGQRLAGFLAVQNTYLAAFQTLGGLGLILGTFGLGAVQLRNVLERRGELALLRATGFRRRTLAALVTIENILLLTAGLGGGLVAAAVAVLPHLAAGGASIPWGTLSATLSAVLAVGLLAGLAAMRATLAAPLLTALRNE